MTGEEEAQVPVRRRLREKTPDQLREQQDRRGQTRERSGEAQDSEQKRARGEEGEVRGRADETMWSKERPESS